MYTLYYIPGTCSLAVHVTLNEIGADFELKNVSTPQGQPRAAEYLAINPRGNVPTLKDENFVIREGAAILTYLIESNQSNLLPKGGHERATALEWLAFANSTLHPAYGRCFFLGRHLGENAGDTPIYGAAIEMIQKCWNEIESELKKHDYIAGKEITVADILLTVIANWTPNLKQPIHFGEKTKALFKRVSQRPSFQKALETEGVSYKITM